MQKEELKEITQKDFEKVCELYSKWKELNSDIKSIASRGINFPEAFSEIMTCFALGFLWNRGSKGDATDKEGNLIEIKATSNYDDDLSSFSPKTEFKKLYFVRLNQEKDEAEIYDMQMDFNSFSELRTNQTQSVKDQQSEKRRPRLSLVKIINEKKLRPCCKIDIVKKEVKNT